MFRAPVSCREPGCGKPSVRDGQGFCAAHKDKNFSTEARRQFDADRADDEIRRMYATSRWFAWRAFLLARRPMCQRLIDGAPCRHAGHLVHHIYSPRARPDLFTGWDNCVVLCDTCHTPEAGTPSWRPGVDYTYVPYDAPMVV